MSSSSLKPFRIQVAEEVLYDLRSRLAMAQWPAPTPGKPWERGTDKDCLQDLVAYWRSEYDWRAQEAELNKYPHYTCEIDGLPAHFLHIKGKGPNPMPLLLTHGWPDSFLRYWKVIPLLTDPASHGGAATDAFDVIIPSIPGFGYSPLPPEGGLNAARVADLWAKLMHEQLGYEKFAAAGGDVGSQVTMHLAFNYPERLLGIYLNDLGNLDELMAMDEQELTAEEKQFRKTAEDWTKKEGGYMSLQSYKPQTLAYGLTDSPLGLAAWLSEKFVSWSDSTPGHESALTRDDLLTNLMIYYTTGSIGSSLQMYYENAHSLPPIGKIKVPAGVSLYPADNLSPPRPWADRKLTNILHWKELPHGGHFTAMEEPTYYATDLREFFRQLR